MFRMVNKKKLVSSQPSQDAALAASFAIATEVDHEVPLNTIKEANQQLLDDAKNHIGVEKTGHGYFAEVHHTATYNLNATEAGINAHATRLDSYDRGSPDIGDDAGRLYNLKFCASPMETLKTALDKPEYAGQILVAPSEQLQEIEAHKERLYEQALANGDIDYAQRIENLQVSEGVGGGGITSAPLTYSDAKDQADLIRSGGTPDFANSYGVEDLGERSLEAAGISIAVSLLPEIKSALQGDKSISEVAKGFGNSLQTRGLKVGGEAFVKAGLSGALAGTEELDPTGAVLIVTLSYEIGKLALDLKNGAIDIAEFKRLSSRTIADKGSSILLTSGAVALLGPAGLITPIIVGQLVANAKLRDQVSAALEGAFVDAEKAIRKQIVILETSKQTLAYTQNTSDACQRTSDVANEGIAASSNSIEILEQKKFRQDEIRRRLLANKVRT